MLLWEAASGNANLVGAINQVTALAGALEAALRARSLVGAGLVQLMTCDHPRQVPFWSQGLGFRVQEESEGPLAASQHVSWVTAETSRSLQMLLIPELRSRELLTFLIRSDC